MRHPIPKRTHIHISFSTPSNFLEAECVILPNDSTVHPSPHHFSNLTPTPVNPKLLYFFSHIFRYPNVRAATCSCVSSNG